MYWYRYVVDLHCYRPIVLLKSANLTWMTKSWRKGFGAVANVPSAAIVVALLKMSRPVSLANTAIRFSVPSSTGPKNLD